MEMDFPNDGGRGFLGGSADGWLQVTVAAVGIIVTGIISIFGSQNGSTLTMSGSDRATKISFHFGIILSKFDLNGTLIDLRYSGLDIKSSDVREAFLLGLGLPWGYEAMSVPSGVNKPVGNQIWIGVTGYNVGPGVSMSVTLINESSTFKMTGSIGSTGDPPAITEINGCKFLDPFPLQGTVVMMDIIEQDISDLMNSLSKNIKESQGLSVLSVESCTSTFPQSRKYLLISSRTLMSDIVQSKNVISVSDHNVFM